MAANVNTELRKLRPAELYNLGVLLSPSGNWKKVMATVTKEGTDDVPKFSTDDISIIEQGARQERKMAALMFLEEWATMGRKRPTVGLLLELLQKTQLFRAADYVSQHILNVAALERPASGPAAPVDVGVVANWMLQHNLDSASASIQSDSILPTIEEIGLSDTDHSLAIEDNDVRSINIRYAESISNRSVGHAETIIPNAEIDAVFPNLSILHLNSSTNEDSNFGANYTLAPAELPSCPAVLDDFNQSRVKNEVGVCSSEKTASDSSLILSSESADRSLDSCDIKSSIDVVDNSTANSQKLPVPVVELFS